MSKGWDVLLHTNLGSFGVLKALGMRARICVVGAKLTVVVKDYPTHQPDPGLPRAVRPMDRFQHRDVA